MLRLYKILLVGMFALASLANGQEVKEGDENVQYDNLKVLEPNEVCSHGGSRGQQLDAWRRRTDGVGNRVVQKALQSTG
jgi:hypothetical protein